MAVLAYLPLRFPGALPGPRVVSADDHLTVHPVFQTEAGGRVNHPQLSDPALQLAALDRRTVDALRAGQAPLWNPDIYGGAPLLADVQSRPGSPVMWLRVGLPAGLAQNLGVAWLLVWMGGGTLLLLLHLGLGPVAALTGAWAAMSTPYLHVWLLHPHASTMVWLPWVLWTMETRRLGWLALAVAGLCAGGHPGTMVHCGLIIAVWFAVRDRSWSTVAAVVVGGLLAGPVLWPALDNGLRSTTLGARVGQSLPAGALADLVWPGLWGHPVHESWTGPGSWADGQLHPGLGALALALVGAWRRPWARVWVVGIAAAALLAWTGLPGPFAHGRLLSLSAWLWALAAAVGVSTVRSPRARIVLAMVVLLTGIHARWSDQSTLPAQAHNPAPAPWALKLSTTLGEGGDAGRVLGLDWMVQPNTGALAGLRDLRGYDLPVSTDTHRLMAALSSPPRAPWYPVHTLPSRGLLDFAAVRAVVTADALPGLPVLDLGPAPVVVHPLDLDAPRAWLATSWQVVGGPEQGLRALQGTVAPRSRPPVEGLGPPPGGAATVHPVSVVENGGAELVLTLPEGTPAGLVVLVDAWAPGWRVRVDGDVAPVVRVGGAFRGVHVHAGSRTVRFYYRPDGWIHGLWAAGLGAVLWLALVGWRARRRDTA